MAGRSRLKAGVPELELPRRFRRRELDHWISRIPSKRGQALTRKRLEAMISKATRA